MIAFLRNHRIAVAGTLVAAAALAWVAFGYFGVHLLFVDDEVSEAAPVFDAAPAAAIVDGPAPTEGGSAVTTTPTSVPDPAPSAPASPEVVTERAGEFTGDAHPTSGRAVVLGNGTGQRFLRFEDFATDNGPDLNVYLVNSATGDVSDVVDLGDLKGNIGEQNYEIPHDVDLDVYDQVVIWCVRFGVGFGRADLA